ncbi:RHS repeat-associated core domain-containing protein [Saccharopolyspora rosea]|uniref:RHS repeat-associated core domain-containing protein n=1 Tax=Saccharopolyspora rosea TaxID=524884 RepID=A0ABW3FXI2_9PSEU
MSNPLVASRQDSTQSFSGVSVLESVEDTKNEINSGSWSAGVDAVGTALDAVGMAMDPFGAILSAGVGWLMEHVGPLSDALDQLTGDPDQIKAHAQTWQNVSEELGDIKTELADRIKKDTAEWSGQAADSYRKRSEDTANLLAAAQSAAEGASNGVSTAGEVVAGVRTMVRDIIADLVGHLVSWALQVVATLGIGMAWVLPQVVSAVAKTVSQIAGITTKLVQAIQKLTKLLSKLGKGFGDVSKQLKKIEADGNGPGGGKPGPGSGKGDPGGPGSTKPAGEHDKPNSDGPASTTPAGAHTSSAPDSPSSGGSHGPVDKSPDSGSAPDVTTPSGATGGGSTSRGGGGSSNKPDNPRDRAIQADDLCTGGSEPVDLATGHVVMTETDLEIRGPLSLVLMRMHVSSYPAGRWFGPTWTSTLDQRLEIDEENVCYFSPDGMILVYPLPAVGSEVLPIDGPRWPLRQHADGSYSLVDPLREHTSRFGRLTAGSRTLPLLAVEDAAGRRIDIEHHRFGPPRVIRHSDGYRVEIDSAGERVTAIRVLDPERVQNVLVMRYAYDDRGRLAEVINSTGKALRFSYDDAGRLTEWRDRNDFWFRYSYDEHGRCVRTTGPDGFFDSVFTYDPERMVTTYTDSLGGVKEFQFNEAKQLVRESDALGGTTLSTWDRYDRLLSRTDPLGRTTHYEYDELGRPKWITRPDGSVVRLYFEGEAVTSIAVDDGERTWFRDYDGEELDPFGGKVGVAAELDLDAIRSGRLDGPGAEPAAEPDRSVLDVFGRPRETAAPGGGRIQLGWTVEGGRAWLVDPLGGRQQWRYDPEGNEIAHVDQLGAVTTAEHGPFETPVADTDPSGARTTRTYDTERRLTSVTNPQGQTWRYTRDLAGRVVAETDFDGRVQRYSYDAAGQLVRSVNGAGEETHYVYDVLGNLVEWRAPSGVTTYTYSPVGHIVRAANDDAVVEFERDDEGRVTAETVNGRTVTFTYDDEASTIRRRTPSGVDSAWNYDTAGRALGLSFGGHWLTFGYDAAGREVNRALDGTVALAQSYDAEQRLTSQEVTLRSGQPVLRRRFHYRPDGELVGVDDGIRGSIRYQIDPVGRVVEVIAPDRRENYRYDGMNNVVASDGLADAETGPRRYAGNTLVAAGAVGFRYDAQGRLVGRTDRTGRTWHYAWDSHDRLVAVTTPEGVVWRYRYDPVGRRIAKQRLAPDASTVVEQVEFAWDGGTLIEQVHTDPNGVRTVTTWAHRPDDGAPVAQLERVGSLERFHAIVTDQVGTPTELVDPAGSLAWHGRTSLWGRELPAPRGAATTPLRFPGQYADAETGLNYNVYRYYDPATGRYLSQDPLGLAPAPNPVAYVGNPHREADPLGLMPKGGAGRKHGRANNAQKTGKGDHAPANNGGSASKPSEPEKKDQKPIGEYEVDGKKYKVDIEAHQNKHQSDKLPGLDVKNTGSGTKFPKGWGEDAHREHTAPNAAKIAHAKQQELREDYKHGGTDVARREAKQNQEDVWRKYQTGDASYDDVQQANARAEAALKADRDARAAQDVFKHDGFLMPDGSIKGGSDPTGSVDGLRYQVSADFRGGSNDVSYHCYPTNDNWDKVYGKDLRRR